MEHIELQRLSKDELIDLVLNLQRPLNNSNDSSTRPSTDKKARRESSRPSSAKPGHAPQIEHYTKNPEFRDHLPEHFECCDDLQVCNTAMELIGEYDEIDLPPIRAYVIRHCRFACACTHCGAPVKRTAPAVAASTLFGKRIHALAIYLKEFQVFSCKRLRALSLDIFGITISERASMNIFLRSHATFELEAHKTRAILRCAKVVASADASVRIKGAKSYYWVFHCKNVVVNQSDYSRSSRFTKEMMEGHVPEVRIFDRYSAQQNLADNHQTCLAHLVRDTAFAFKQWFTKVFALARDIGSCAATKLAVKKRELKKQLNNILDTTTSCDLVRKLQNKIGRAKEQLLVLSRYPGEVEATNNGSKRKLQPSMIQREVTNGYRAKWTPNAEVDVRTIVDTAKHKGQKFLPNNPQYPRLSQNWRG